MALGLEVEWSKENGQNPRTVDAAHKNLESS